MPDWNPAWTLDTGEQERSGCRKGLIGERAVGLGWTLLKEFSWSFWSGESEFLVVKYLVSFPGGPLLVSTDLRLSRGSGALPSLEVSPLAFAWSLH